MRVAALLLFSLVFLHVTQSSTHQGDTQMDVDEAAQVSYSSMPALESFEQTVPPASDKKHISQTSPAKAQPARIEHEPDTGVTQMMSELKFVPARSSPIIPSKPKQIESHLARPTVADNDNLKSLKKLRMKVPSFTKQSLRIPPDLQENTFAYLQHVRKFLRYLYDNLYDSDGNPEKFVVGCEKGFVMPKMFFVANPALESFASGEGFAVFLEQKCVEHGDNDKVYDIHYYKMVMQGTKKQPQKDWEFVKKFVRYQPKKDPSANTLGANFVARLLPFSSEDEQAAHTASYCCGLLWSAHFNLFPDLRSDLFYGRWV